MIPLNKPDVTEHEVGLVSKCLRDGWVSHRSPYNRNFERVFSERVRMPAMACSSGTAALWLALKACGVGAGDRVAVPAFTFAAPAHAVMALGAVPVPIDVDASSWLMNVPLMEITGPHRLIIDVQLFGNFLGIWTATPIIQDCAQSLESAGLPFQDNVKYRTYSFYANKVMTTGEGGMVVGQNLGEAKRWRDQGMTDGKLYNHVVPGLNFRLSGIQAALGLAQLSRLDELISARRHVAARYQAALGQGRGLWQYAIEVDDSSGLVDHLEKHEVEAKMSWPALTKLPYIKKFHDCPVAERLARHVVMLPIYPSMTTADQDRVIELVVAGGFAPG